MDTAPGTREEPWRERLWLLPALGGGLAVIIQWLIEAGENRWTEEPLRLAAGLALFVGGILFGLIVERARVRAALLFAAGAGVAAGALLYWNGSPAGWSANEGWRMTASLIAAGLAAPLFQTWGAAGRPLDPAAAHGYGWANLVLWFAAWAVALAAFLLAQLLAQLFSLIGIRTLRELLMKDWFVWTLLGSGFGLGLAMLRDRQPILSLFRRVVTSVLAALAPVLAIGLLLFLLFLPFTGVEPLWQQTKATTPILLSCLLGAVLLANAVIGIAPEEEAAARPLRWSGATLAGVALPLALLAALSTGKRIAQYGLTPERLWAVIFVVAATATGIAYLIALARGRARWPDMVRPANVRLAAGFCVLAVVLATPLLDFGGWSARDQVARLQSGRVSAERFDWAAMRFDFGPAGRRELARLAQGGPAEARRLARRALASRERGALGEEVAVAARAKSLVTEILVTPVQVPLPDELRDALARGSVCAVGPCSLIWEAGRDEAIATGFGCPSCFASVTRLVRQSDGQWQPVALTTEAVPAVPSRRAAQVAARQRSALRQGRVEVREVRRRQVFVDGRPVTGTF